MRTTLAPWLRGTGLSATIKYCRAPHTKILHTLITPRASRVLQRRQGGLREASTAPRVAAESPSAAKRLRTLFYVTCATVFLVSGYYAVTDVRFSFHRWLFVPLLRYIYDDAEEAHSTAIKTLKILNSLGLHPRERGNSDSTGDLQIQVSFTLGFSLVVRQPRYNVCYLP